MPHIARLPDRGTVAVTGPMPRNCCRVSSPTIWTCWRPARRPRRPVVAAGQDPVRVHGRADRGDGYMLETGRAQGRRPGEAARRCTSCAQGRDQRSRRAGGRVRRVGRRRAERDRARRLSPTRALPALGWRLVRAAAMRRCAEAERRAATPTRPIASRWASRRPAMTTCWATRSRTRPDLDLLDGVSFNKGCFIGQEVVSRMQHRGTARKRFVS